MRSVSSFIRIVTIVVFGYFFLEWIGSTDETSAFQEQPWLWALLGVIALIYIAGEVIVESIRAVLYGTLNEEAKARYDYARELAKKNQFKWAKELYQRLTASKPLEQEGEIILDHNYDGIRELDNKLPPWWVYGFYATIIFAVVYMARYHIFGGVDQEGEYDIAVAEAKLEIEEWKRTAKDLVDVNTVEVLTDASDLQAGKTIYEVNCAVCHKVDGGGGIGPNLTDDRWILGGGIKNVFNTISEGGRSGKGMIPWKTNLRPAEMAQVASYVLSFQGTDPAEPKEPEGEIWVDENTNMDDIEVEIDSVTAETTARAQTGELDVDVEKE